MFILSTATRNSKNPVECWSREGGDLSTGSTLVETEKEKPHEGPRYFKRGPRWKLVGVVS